jgi:hypothetical protein
MILGEIGASVHIIEPGHHYPTIRLETNLTRSHYNLEGAAVIP